MQIELLNLTVRDLSKGYQDNLEEGVIGYDGKLDIRPPYQREFVYNEKQRNAVIDTVSKKFPLNVMYWAVRESDNFEIIDGQQRTISICQFIQGDFSYKDKYFHNLNDDEKNRLLDYELTIYLCSGSDSERLDWFKTINIAGEKLTDQEIRNAVYHGSWVSDAKRYFSKNGCPAYGVAGDYLTGSAIRQDYLETTIKWINDDKIEDYMAKNQHESSAKELWTYFDNVFYWVDKTFIQKRKKLMKGVSWGKLYNKHQNKPLDPIKLEKQISKLIIDSEVTNQKGIYEYVLTGNEKHLNIRKFDDQMKQRAYEKQNGICNKCNREFELQNMDADHIIKWKDGGKTEDNNCQVLFVRCNRSGV